MKKINLDETFKQDAIKKFTEFINKTKFSGNSINFTTEINQIINSTEIPKPTVYISATAYLKMMLYIRDTDIEIAWHGTVERNIENNWYHIKDVFLYPQTLTAVTVNTDQEKYQEWLQNIEDDAVFNNIRFQGHSHVNMGTSPSGTDLNMYNNFLQVLPKNDYYIFMIMNKSGNLTCLIYDLDKNLIYENQDINVKILTNNTTDLMKDIAEEKEKYCTKQTYFNSYQNTAYDIFNSPQYTGNTHYNSVDDIFNDIDRKSKYKNPTLHPNKSKKGNKKK
jgi:hypothetical protein